MLKSMSIPALLLAAAGVANAAEPLTVVVFPRGNQDAVNAAFIEPVRTTGVPVTVLSYDGETAELEQMVKAGRTSWDLVQVETRALELGCRNGWFEKIDPAKIRALPDLVPGAVSECGVATFVWAQALAYNAARFDARPASWADFWDVKRFPGNRGLRRSAKYTLEIALLADGVAPADVYKVLATKQGADRAFRKLDQIKAHTVWWDAAEQPVLFLAAGRVDMASAYTLYVDRARRRGVDLEVVWPGNIYDFDHWAIPRGSRHVADAYRFIALASEPARQKAFVDVMPFGPVNAKALRLIDAKLANGLPSAPQNSRQALPMNIPFWMEHGRELEERFSRWVPEPQLQVVEEHVHDDGAADHGQSHDVGATVHPSAEGADASPHPHANGAPPHAH